MGHVVVDNNKRTAHKLFVVDRSSLVAQIERVEDMTRFINISVRSIGCYTV